MDKLKRTPEIQNIIKKRRVFYYSTSFIIILCAGFVYFFGFCRSFFGSTFFSCPNINPSDMRAILLIFPAILSTVTAIIFAIPWPNSVEKFPINKRKVILFYLLWMVPNIIFPILVFANVFKLSQVTFNLSLLLFIFSLCILVPYVMIFSQANRSSKISLWFGMAARSNLIIVKKFNEKRFLRIKEAASAIRDLILEAVQDNDQKGFREGIKKSYLLLSIVLKAHNSLRKKELIKRIDLIVKDFLQNFCIIAFACIEYKDSRKIRIISRTIDIVIRETMELEREYNSFDYPIYIGELKKIAIICLQNNLSKGAGDIVDKLGALEEKTLAFREGQAIQLKTPPDLSILSSLEQIGIQSAKGRFESLTIDILMRLRSIADMASQNVHVNQHGMILEEALKSYWIVSAFMFKFIDETAGWLRENDTWMRNAFGVGFDRAYGLAESELEMSSFIGLKVLREYKKELDGAEEDVG